MQNGFPCPRGRRPRPVFNLSHAQDVRLARRGDLINFSDLLERLFPALGARGDAFGDNLPQLRDPFIWDGENEPPCQSVLGRLGSADVGSDVCSRSDMGRSDPFHKLRRKIGRRYIVWQ